VDVGSGTGEIVGWLLDDGFTTYGCEVNPSRAAEARIQHPSATIACADVREWTPPRIPSLVTCIEVIEHLERSQQSKLLIHIRQWLRHDSILILSTPQRTSLVSVLERVYCHWKKLEYHWWDSTHVSVLPRTAMRRELVAAGFRIVDQVGIGLVPDVVRSRLGPFRVLVKDRGHRGIVGILAFDVIYVCEASTL
jgi:hypothetical protein